MRDMNLLKLVIVDDEPILLEGLLRTYNWKDMGFEVVGSAKDGEEAIQVIKDTHPHVVLTDIRMKKISGLMVMEEIEKEEMDCLFIVLSAYRDFEYAKQACDLGAFAYLLKPIKDDELLETMRGAYELCIEQIKNEEKYENWENLLIKDSDSFLQTVLQKYLQNRLSAEKVERVFETLDTGLGKNDKFIAVYADIDLAYKITNSLEYDATRGAMLQSLRNHIGELFFYWTLESEDGACAFIVKTKDTVSVSKIKQIFEKMKENECPVVAAIGKPYKGIMGIKKSYEEAKNLFELARMSGTSAFKIPEGIVEQTDRTHSEDGELFVVNAIRRNDAKELKEAFIQFIYGLPDEEEQQLQYIHKVMLKVEFMLKDSYGMTEELREQFQNYYSNLLKLSAAKAVDVCYKILCGAIEKRKEKGDGSEAKYFREYMSEAVAYIEEHLNEEQLSIVSVANHVYLNSVYFGRVFKNTFHMTFKKYLMKRRMERAKNLLEDGKISIGAICEQVGISNPSYFSHLFKEYTGKLPSEYKKEYDV